MNNKKLIYIFIFYIMGSIQGESLANSDVVINKYTGRYYIGPAFEWNGKFTKITAVNDDCRSVSNQTGLKYSNDSYFGGCLLALSIKEYGYGALVSGFSSDKSHQIYAVSYASQPKQARDLAMQKCNSLSESSCEIKEEWESFRGGPDKQISKPYSMAVITNLSMDSYLDNLYRIIARYYERGGGSQEGQIKTSSKCCIKGSAFPDSKKDHYNRNFLYQSFSHYEVPVFDDLSSVTYKNFSTESYEIFKENKYALPFDIIFHYENTIKALSFSEPKNQYERDMPPYMYLHREGGIKIRPFNLNLDSIKTVKDSGTSAVYFKSKNDKPAILSGPFVYHNGYKMLYDFDKNDPYRPNSKEFSFESFVLRLGTEYETSEFAENLKKVVSMSEKMLSEPPTLNSLKAKSNNSSSESIINGSKRTSLGKYNSVGNCFEYEGEYEWKENIEINGCWKKITRYQVRVDKSNLFCPDLFHAEERPRYVNICAPPPSSNSSDSNNDASSTSGCSWDGMAAEPLNCLSR